jgi:hypothetical protein
MSLRVAHSRCGRDAGVLAFAGRFRFRKAVDAAEDELYASERNGA